MSRLMDERSDPPLRAVIGGLLARCTRADIAVANIRLAALDLGDAELEGVSRCRILLGGLDARALHGSEHSDAAALERSRALLRFLESDRVRIRSAGRSSWVPDFSLYHQPGGRVALIGAHYFREPIAARGPSLTCMLTDAASADLLAARFDELWNGGHDVGAAVRDTVRQWIARQVGTAPDPDAAA
jgi:hypothetical protein